MKDFASGSRSCTHGSLTKRPLFAIVVFLVTMMLLPAVPAQADYPSFITWKIHWVYGGGSPNCWFNPPPVFPPLWESTSSTPSCADTDWSYMGFPCTSHGQRVDGGREDLLGECEAWHNCGPDAVGTRDEGDQVICLVDFAADKNLGEKCQEEPSSRANPCNTENGNKFQKEEDMPGVPGAPAFIRHYNSLLHKNVSMGYGWTSSVQKRLEITGSSVLIRQADGRGESFSCNATTCTGNADSGFLLTPSAGGYTLTYPDGATDSYDATGKLLSATDTGGRTTSYVYDSAGRLTSVTGAFGHTISFGYDAAGRIATSTDPAAQITSYAYDGNDNLVQVNYPDGTARRYHYEETASFPHHLTGISFIDATGVVTRYSTYAYNTNLADKRMNGKVASSEHAGGYDRFSFSYRKDTGSTFETTVTDASNTSEVISFALSLGVRNLILKVNQADSKNVTQTFDARNNLLCRKDEEGRVTTYTYNTTNQKTSMTEGQTGSCASPQTTSATRTTTYQYVSSTRDLPTVIESPSVYTGAKKRTEIAYAGNLPTSITQRGFTPAGVAVSRTVSMGYNSLGQVTSVNGPRTDVNDVTTLVYNECATGGGCGQLSSITNALGQTTTFDTYNADGRLSQMTDANGLRTSYQYDARGRVRYLTQTPPAGTARITEYRYNAAGDITFVAFPDGRTLTYTYNAARKLTRVTDNASNYISYGYDLKGNRTQEYTYDPANTLVRQIDLAYDVRNRIASINAAGSLTSQVHDALGNLTQTIDPNNNPATTHGYDALNRLLQTVNSLGGTTSYGYDVNDQLKQVQAPNSVTTQYSYDDLGNLLSETSPDRGTTTYTYDTSGNVKTRTDARGISASYNYDALNRVTGVDYPGSAEDITYIYDSCSNGIGRLCQVTDASGTTSFGYNSLGNMIQHAKTELGVTYTTAYTYDAADRVTGITYPGGRVVAYVRDALGRISGVTATVNGSTQTIVSNRAYRADSLLTGQLFGNGVNEVRQYDLQGRLTTQFVGSADTRLYGYDANSNLTSFQSLPQVAGYQYDALDRLTSDQITSTPSSGAAFNYDANGNRLSYGKNTYRYATASNRLTRVGRTTISTDVAGNITGDGTYAYAYNNTDHLVSVTSGATTIASYVYNDQRQRTRKLIGATGAQTVFHYDLQGRLIAETTASGSLVRNYVYAEEVPLAQIDQGEALLYLHTDHEGTARLATNPSGTKVWSWEGRAFGDTLPTGIATVNLRFPGQYYDAESWLFYNWNRYYNSKIGRYLTSDPIGLAGGLNTYSYVYNNPLKYTDPSGLFVQFIPPVIAVVEGIINTIGAAVITKAAYDAGLLSPKPAPEPEPAADNGGGGGGGGGGCPEECDFSGLAGVTPKGEYGMTIRCAYHCPTKGTKTLVRTISFRSQNPAFLCPRKWLF